jgi:preprotein translocase subunit SecF
MKYNNLALIISGSLILLSLVSLVLHGGPKYGIDFLGGIELRIHFEKDVRVGDVRDALLATGFSDPSIKKLAGESDAGADILIFVHQDATTKAGQSSDASAPDLSAQIENALSKKFTDNPFTEVQKNLVGPKIGGELREAAIWAVLISMGMILIYISYRFEFKFALGAVAALFHDVIITLGVFSWFNFEISLSIIAAFLTIVGYSLNDTIVVFDRIRENMKIMRKDSLTDITNKSINQSLSRTINTSGTTLLVVVALFFLGGEVLKYFALAMIIGVGIGTYSSNYIASPIVIAYHNRFEQRRLHRLNDQSAAPKDKKKAKA